MQYSWFIFLILTRFIENSVSLSLPRTKLSRKLVNLNILSQIFQCFTLQVADLLLGLN